ncbi:MAG: hypothetical protein EXR27_20390 [Betaproteobacteria bacterium]|nr:hypothetical protein [Betaproteobacteria bacterium]
MTVHTQIQHLVSVATKLWAGEAELVRTYWDSPKRTTETDLKWLARQCFKEFWGTGANKYDRGGVFFGMLNNLHKIAPNVDISVDREEILEAVEVFHAEFSHYCAFARAYDAIRPAGSPKMSPHGLESWPEEDALTALRLGHIKEHEDIGQRAARFTEGGYCALFSEGMKLQGRGGAEEKIASACSLVYEDEFNHMLVGIAGIANTGMRDADWKLMEDLVVQQLRARILMRNAQFNQPLDPARIDAIYRGDIEPIRFDYAKAGLQAPQ